jgi:negative regulator of replication initiation
MKDLNLKPSKGDSKTVRITNLVYQYILSHAVYGDSIDSILRRLLNIKDADLPRSTESSEARKTQGDAHRHKRKR